jgi:hypothetical protein
MVQAACTVSAYLILCSESAALSSASPAFCADRFTGAQCKHPKGMRHGITAGFEFSHRGHSGHREIKIKAKEHAILLGDQS